MDLDVRGTEDLVADMRAGGDPERLRQTILDLAALYAEIKHSPAPFQAGRQPAGWLRKLMQRLGRFARPVDFALSASYCPGFFIIGTK